MMFVAQLKMILVMTLALFWLGASSHCLLERLPGLEFLRCASDATASPSCEDAACAAVESGNYKVQDNHDAVPQPPLAFAFDLPSERERSVNDSGGVVLRAAHPPPSLQPSWQFSCRAAAPVRAPSLLA